MLGNEEPQNVRILSHDGKVDNTLQLIRVDSATDDEINLIDLWLVLSRRRNVILATTAILLSLALLAVLLMPAKYEFSVALQIGTIISGKDNRQIEFIESPENVLAKLQESYIPLIVSDYLKAHPDQKAAPDISARIPRKSELIVIETKGKEDNSETYKALLQKIVDQVKQEQKPQADMIKSEYASLLKREQIILSTLKAPATLQSMKVALDDQLLQASIALEKLKDERLRRVERQQLQAEKQAHQNKLSALDDDSRQLTSELKQLDKVDKLLEKQLADLSSTIASELTTRQASMNDVNSGSEAMTMLLIDNQIQANRNRLAQIEDRYYIKQHNQREKLNNQLKDIQRQRGYQELLVTDTESKLQKLDIENQLEQQKMLAQVTSLKARLAKMQLDYDNSIQKQQHKVEDIASKLHGIKETQTLTQPMQSLQPVGPRKKLILVGSLLAGLFLGVFVAFVLEFMVRVKERTQQV